jgi:multiple sugar transport system permease protein
MADTGAVRDQKGKSQRRRHERTTALAFIAPATIVVCLVGIVPVVFLLAVSLFEYRRGDPLESAEFVGAENYIRYLSGNDSFAPALMTTGLLVVVSVTASLAIGVLLAACLDRIGRGRRVFVTALIVPISLAPVMAGLVWRLMFNDLYGVINAILRPLGLDQPWLGHPTLAFTAVSVVQVWLGVPFVVLVMFAAFRSVDPRPLEAAQLDGAGAWRVFWHVQLPMVAPILGLVVTVKVIDALRIFEAPFALTQGGPGTATETVGLLIYRLGLFSAGFVGRASALAVILLALTAILVILGARFLRRAEGAES